MHEFMVTLNNDDDEEAKQEMITNCRQQYEGKNKMQSNIDDFNDQSMILNKENAIRWYTANSFIHRCTNMVLRKENISQVYTYRYIIKLLCQQLKELHKVYIDKYKQKQRTKLRVYRGQYLKSDQIELLKKNRGSLISLNGFVSTTKDKHIGLDFIRNFWQEGFEPVLFKIDVDMTNEHSVAFADVSEFSKYPEEKEVLFSIGSVFSVESVEFDNVGDELELHIIHLSIKQDNQLTVTKYIEQTYARNVDSADKAVLFGKLLFDMGESEAAIKYFSDALDRLSDHNNHLRPIYLNNLGVCYTEKDQALKCYQSALKIYQQTGNQRGLSACQHNVSLLFCLNFCHCFDIIDSEYLSCSR
jgi:tetratricopeptide (TPR) repeat protein